MRRGQALAHDASKRKSGIFSISRPTIFTLDVSACSMIVSTAIHTNSAVRDLRMKFGEMYFCIALERRATTAEIAASRKQSHTRSGTVRHRPKHHAWRPPSARPPPQRSAGGDAIGAIEHDGTERRHGERHTIKALMAAASR